MNIEAILKRDCPGREVYKSGTFNGKTFVIAPTKGLKPFEDMDCSFVIENGYARQLHIPDELTEISEAIPDPM